MPTSFLVTIESPLKAVKIEVSQLANPVGTLSAESVDILVDRTERGDDAGIRDVSGHRTLRSVRKVLYG